MEGDYFYELLKDFDLNEEDAVLFVEEFGLYEYVQQAAEEIVEIINFYFKNTDYVESRFKALEYVHELTTLELSEIRRQSLKDWLKDFDSMEEAMLFPRLPWCIEEYLQDFEVIKK